MPRKSPKQSRRLSRYTSLPILLDLLRRKKIVLLDPSTWEDKNDSQIILKYKAVRKLEKLFAICFSVGNETVHHWKSYANGISGCCIEFDKDKLLKSFQGIKEIRYGKVVYKKIKEVEKANIELEQMPFLKRYPYRIEREFRILWEGQTNQENIEIDIDLNSINKITISQNMPNDVYCSIVDLLKSITRNPSRKINRSTLYENKRWIKALIG